MGNKGNKWKQGLIYFTLFTYLLTVSRIKSKGRERTFYDAFGSPCHRGMNSDISHFANQTIHSFRSWVDYPAVGSHM